MFWQIIGKYYYMCRHQDYHSRLSLLVDEINIGVPFTIWYMHLHIAIAYD